MLSVSLFRYALSTVTVVAALAAQAVTPLDGPAPVGDAVAVLDSGEKWLVCKVVDGVTGAPIPGAEVLLLAEADTPIAAELPVAMRFEAGNDGLVAARVDPGAEDYQPWSWMCARADGYGHAMAMQSFDWPVVRLTPGGVLPVEVRDWRDEPVEGALVGFCSGCGHTPDLAHGYTDAKGRLTLNGVDIHQGIADLYLVHPDLDLGYLSPDYYPSARPLVLRTGPGVVHRGVVVDPQGRPVAGAAVGLSTVHRGPWTRTGADGSFTLCGLEQRSDLWVYTDGRRLLFEETGSDSVRLQLPLRAGDDAQGVQVLDLSDEQRDRRDDARERDQAAAAARAKEWPRVPVQGLGLPDDVTVTMKTRSASWDLSEPLASGEPVPLPDGEFVFWVEAEDSLRVVRGDRDAAVAAGAVRLRWFPSTRIDGRVVDERGDPLRARAFVGEPGSAPPADVAEWQELRGELSLATTRSGPSWLFVARAGVPGQRILSVDLPPRGDDVLVDVGELVVSSQPAHRFERSDGTPLEEGTVQLIRAGWSDLDGRWSWIFEADEDGRFWLPDLQRGDALLVRSELPAAAGLEEVEVVTLPSRFVIGGRAPEVFRMHGGEVLLEVDAGGEPVYATFDDRVVPLDGATVVRGLRPKDFRVLLGAAGHRGVAVDLDETTPARASERRALTVRLP